MIEEINPNFDPKIKDIISEDNMDYKYTWLKVITAIYVTQVNI